MNFIVPFGIYSGFGGCQGNRGGFGLFLLLQHGHSNTNGDQILPHSGHLHPVLILVFIIISYGKNSPFIGRGRTQHNYTTSTTSRRRSVTGSGGSMGIVTD